MNDDGMTLENMRRRIAANRPPISAAKTLESALGAEVKRKAKVKGIQRKYGMEPGNKIPGVGTGTLY